METKQAPAITEIVRDNEGALTGEFTALVSVFNNIDVVGDRVVPGAFQDTLKVWETSGDPIPVIWAHQWQDPDLHIGTVVKAEETPEGLLVTGQLDMTNPKAKTVAKLLAERRVKEFSIGYGVREQSQVDDVRELKAIELFEIGPCLKGANPDTVLVSAKTDPGTPSAPPARGPVWRPGELSLRLNLLGVSTL